MCLDFKTLKFKKTTKRKKRAHIWQVEDYKCNYIKINKEIIVFVLKPKIWKRKYLI